MPDTVLADFRPFSTRDDASQAAAARVRDALDARISEAGAASLMVSGGSTPVQMFGFLAAASLGWQNVTIGLVDERWVPPDDPGSNECLVRHTLLVGPVAQARFLPMKTDAVSADEAAPERACVYGPHCAPISVLLLGMGTDGHTASWFPGSPSLGDALAPRGGACVVSVDAAGCPGAGAYASRLTLSGPAILGAQAAVLLIFGEEKRVILEQAARAPAIDFPVRHVLDGLGERLAIFWAP